MSTANVPTSSAGYAHSDIPAAAVCEPAYTSRFATLCLLLLAAALAACGGSSHPASYQHAVSKQEACCNGLADQAAKQSCLDHIVRVEDPEVQKSDANMATYSCIERNFVCDPFNRQRDQGVGAKAARLHQRPAAVAPKRRTARLLGDGPSQVESAPG